jgi:hypothetical protein
MGLGLIQTRVPYQRATATVEGAQAVGEEAKAKSAAWEACTVMLNCEMCCGSKGLSQIN